MFVKLQSLEERVMVQAECPKAMSVDCDIPVMQMPNLSNALHSLDAFALMKRSRAIESC